MMEEPEMGRKKTKLSQQDVAQIKKLWEGGAKAVWIADRLLLPLSLVVECVIFLDDHVPMPTQQKKIVRPSMRNDTPKNPITVDEIMDFVKVKAVDFWTMLKQKGG